MQNRINNKTIGKIVRDDYRTAEVFKKFNIDFCCGGKKTIEEVCSTNNISVEQLTNALSEIEKNSILIKNKISRIGSRIFWRTIL